MPELWLFSGADPQRFTLTVEPATIGRAQTNSICLPDPTVSSRHARVVAEADGWLIEDLGSRNGTFLNDHPVTRARLSPGDRIRICDIELTFEEGVVLEDDSPDLSIFASVPAIPPGFFDRPPSPDALALRPKETAEEKTLHLIQRIGEKLIETTSLEQLADDIASILAQRLAADRVVVCLFDENKRPVPIASSGVRPGETVRFSSTVLRRMQDEKAGILIKSAGASDDSIESLQLMNVGSTLCVPLWMSDRIMGFMSLDLFPQERTFTSTDLQVLMPIAHQAAVGIERCRLAREAAEHEHVNSYLSKYLDEKIVKQIGESKGVDPLEPTEREVTIMFSDIVSFTKMSEGLPPPVLSDFVHQYLTAMTQIIFQYGGTIDKYIGDAVMAIFGAPVSDPDAPKSALRAALAMIECVKRTQPPDGVTTPLRVRVGLGTGRAVVGNIGSEQRVEYTAIGDLVNVASRLETFARPNEICIDEQTFEYAGSGFEMHPIGSVDVKNRNEPVQVYQVLRENSPPANSGIADTQSGL